MINNKIEDLKLKASPISSYIGKYINVSKKGSGYIASCPFHSDSNPSLSISDEKGIWKCFSCSNSEARKGGDIFTFVKLYKKLDSWYEAVKYVASEYKFDLGINQTKNNDKQLIFDIYDSSIDFASSMLLNTSYGKQALDYLNNRGINKEIIKHFNIGFMPSEVSLYEYLIKEGYKADDLKKAELVSIDKHNRVYDFFKARIIFPIFNIYGQPLAFTGRYLNWQSGSNISKYINTGDSKHYVKGNVLYNYHQVKQEIINKKEVIVVEGVMDVIAYYKAGIYNVVSTLGTACSENQIKLLRSLSNNIILSYDGDRAGVSANLELGKKLVVQGFDVTVLNNDTSLDPDEIVMQYGIEKLHNMLENKLTYINYVFNILRSNYNLKNYSDKIRFKDELYTYVNLYKDYNTKKDLKNLINNLLYDNKIKQSSNIISDYKEADKLAEYKIINFLMQCEKAKEQYKYELGYLLDAELEELAKHIIKQNYNNLDLNKLSELLKDSKYYNRILEMLSYKENDSNFKSLEEEYSADLMNQAIAVIKKEQQFRLYKQLQAKLEDNIISISELSEYSKLKKELKGYTKTK